jgi:hypothetical protein
MKIHLFIGDLKGVGMRDSVYLGEPEEQVCRNIIMEERGNGGNY